MHASLNLFLNSRSYLIAKNIDGGSDVKAVDIEIHQMLETERHTSLFEVFTNYSIPENGDGRYLQLNVTGLVTKWFHSHNTTHGVVIKVKSSVDGAPLSHNFVSLDKGNLLKVSLCLLLGFRTLEMLKGIFCLLIIELRTSLVFYLFISTKS